MDKKIQTPADTIDINCVVKPARPNESAAFSVEAHVKIFDPNTDEVFVEKRA